MRNQTDSALEHDAGDLRQAGMRLGRVHAQIGLAAGGNAAVATQQQFRVRHLHVVPGVLVRVQLVDYPEPVRTEATAEGQPIGRTRVVVTIDVLPYVDAGCMGW